MPWIAWRLRKGVVPVVGELEGRKGSGIDTRPKDRMICPYVHVLFFGFISYHYFSNLSFVFTLRILISLLSHVTWSVLIFPL